MVFVVLRFILGLRNLTILPGLLFYVTAVVVGIPYFQYLGNGCIYHLKTILSFLFFLISAPFSDGNHYPIVPAFG